MSNILKFSYSKKDKEMPGDLHARQGLDALDNEDYGTALSELERAVNLGVRKYNLAEIHTIIGVIYRKRLLLSKAIEAHKTALEIEPDFYKAWNNLGAVYREKGQLDEAERCIRKSLSIAPDYVFAQVALGTVYIDKGIADRAIEILEKAIVSEPRISVFHANLAVAYATGGRFDEARVSLNQATALGYKDWRITQRQIDKLEAREQFKKKETIEVDLDISRPMNEAVLRYLGRNKGKDVPPIAHPDSVFDPYYEQGSHPEIVKHVWDSIGASLPEDCRYLIYGTPALAHPKTGIIFAFCCGTTYCLRLPLLLLEEALDSGAKTHTKWSSDGDMDTQRDLGSDWVFGGWVYGDDERAWCNIIYEEAGFVT